MLIIESKLSFLLRISLIPQLNIKKTDTAFNGASFCFIGLLLFLFPCCDQEHYRTGTDCTYACVQCNRCIIAGLGADGVGRLNGQLLDCEFPVKASDLLGVIIAHLGRNIERHIESGLCAGIEGAEAHPIGELGSLIGGSCEQLAAVTPSVICLRNSSEPSFAPSERM